MFWLLFCGRCHPQPQKYEKNEVLQLQYWSKISVDTVCYWMVCVWEELNTWVQKYHYKTLYNLNSNYTSSKIAKYDN
jgi:hypothetical protein